MRTTARGFLALVTGLLVTAGLLSATTAPASAGQVGVTIQIRGAGSVHVVEGSLEDGGAASCVRDDNQNHHVTVTCPRIRNSEVFEAWVWLRATPAPYPAGDWIFESWDGCDRTRLNAGPWECAVHSGAFSSDERYPVAVFRDTRAPVISGLEVQQVPDFDRQFRVSFATGADARAECQVYGVSSWTQCWNGYVLTVPEGTHTIKVRSADPSGNATTVDRVVTSVDTAIIAGPEQLTSDDMADFRFRTAGGDTFSCSVDGAEYTPCGGGLNEVWMLDVMPDGQHTLKVRASKGTWVDPVPAEWSWTLDTVAPTSTIHAGVGGTAASFRFTHSEPASTECKLDTPAGPGAWEGCSSSLSLTGLAQGEHQLWVRARDAAGNVQATPATYTWTVDTVAPTTTLDGNVSADRATFAFAAPGAASFECRLATPSAAGSWAGCSSPTTYTGLVPGSHRFEVRATDAAGNVEQVPATHAWTATAPVTTTPVTTTPVTTTPGTPTPGAAEPSVTRAPSATRAAWKVSATRKGKVIVVVSAASAPTGTVVVKDRGRTIGRGVLTASHQGRVVVRIPRLSKGRHVLVVRYGGSATTVGSSSARRIVTLR